MRAEIDAKAIAGGSLDLTKSPRVIEEAAAKHPVNKVPPTEPTRTVKSPRATDPNYPPTKPPHRRPGYGKAAEDFDNVYADPPTGKTVTQSTRDIWRRLGELFNSQFIGIRKMQRQLEK